MSDLPSGICKRANLSRPLVKRAFWSEYPHRLAPRSLWPVFVALVLLGVPFPARGQGLPDATQSPSHIGRRTSTGDTSIAGQQALQQHKLLGLLNAERQKSMVSDAAKLLRLAQELNAELMRGNSALSPSQQAHKAAEIEKLAHNVREKMSFAVGMTQELESPFNASIP